MTLDRLLIQLLDNATAIRRSNEVTNNLARQREEIECSVTDQISNDFGMFVAVINKSLPKDKRITKWYMHKYNGNERASVTIMELDGKPYSDGDRMTLREPLPACLEGIKRFDQGYPIKVTFDMQNHAYLGESLDELK